MLNARQQRLHKRELRLTVGPGGWEGLPGGGTFWKGSSGDYKSPRVSNSRLGTFYIVMVYSVGRKESLKHIELGRVIISYSFSGGSAVKKPPANAGDAAGASGSNPGLGRSPGEENGNPLHYSCLESPLDRGAWQATVHGVTNSEHDLAAEHACKHH